MAKKTELTELEVRNVISYYSMLRTKPAGKYNIQVCTNISCMLRGGYEILDHVIDLIYSGRAARIAGLADELLARLNR